MVELGSADQRLLDVEVPIRPEETSAPHSPGQRSLAPCHCHPNSGHPSGVRRNMDGAC